MDNKQTSLNLAIKSSKISANLKKYETDIRAGLASFIAVGRSLKPIKEDALYKERGFKSFTNYVETMFDITVNYGYKQINAYEVWAILKEAKFTPMQLPSNEGQCRPLREQNKEIVLSVWSDVTATGKRITARLVQETFDKVLGKEKPKVEEIVETEVKPSETDIPTLQAEIVKLKNELTKVKPIKLSTLAKDIVLAGFNALVKDAGNDDKRKAELMKAKAEIIA